MTTVQRIRLMLLVCACAALIVVWVPKGPLPHFFAKQCYCLEVSFLDVGQGDSILIQTPDGYEMLVDGGPNASVLRSLAVKQSFFDRTIDIMVATHPDADHIGGLVDVLKRYQIKTILSTENKNETSVAAAYAVATDAEHAQMLLADAGQVISLGASTTIQIFSPAGDEKEWESNTSSIVMRVVYGDTSFMLTGDAPAEIEEYLVKTYGAQLDSDVLKLGHHGSKTSSSESFLDAVTPEYVVVSAGIGNKYGHPHQEVMQRVFARNIKTAHTGTDGTVTFESDGKTLWRK